MLREDLFCHFFPITRREFKRSWGGLNQVLNGVEAYSWTYFLADVATECPSLHVARKMRGDVFFEFYGGVANTAIGIYDLGCDDGVGGTGINAGRARSAVIGGGRIGINSKSNINSERKKYEPLPLVSSARSFPTTPNRSVGPVFQRGRSLQKRVRGFHRSSWRKFKKAWSFSWWPCGSHGHKITGNFGYVFGLFCFGEIIESQRHHGFCSRDNCLGSTLFKVIFHPLHGGVVSREALLQVGSLGVKPLGHGNVAGKKAQRCRLVFYNFGMPFGGGQNSPRCCPSAFLSPRCL